MSYLFLTLIYVGMARSYHNEFVTLRHSPIGSHNWTFGDAAAETSANYLAVSRYEHDWTLYYDIGERYRLRFKPVRSMPRLFWHKFPKPQIETAIPPTAAPTEEESPPATTESAEPTISPTEQFQTTTEASPPSTTPMNMSTSSTSYPPYPTRPVHRPSSTMTTIMRPPPPRKQQLFFGSPLKLNLLRQQQHNAGRNATTKTRSKGFLSLFEVIKFANTKCTVSMGDIRAMEGVCYHEFECKSLGGIPMQPCADGVGVCCVFLSDCGDTTKQSVVYFESPNYPNPVHEPMICVLTVNLRDNVQQLRLDFLLFELNRPTDGDCIDDQFIVSGQNINFVVPVLCGINTGQHLYIHAGNSFENKIYISFFAKVSGGGRSFNIKVTQNIFESMHSKAYNTYICLGGSVTQVLMGSFQRVCKIMAEREIELVHAAEDDLAPDGCLQYYTEPEGVLKSFNYDAEGSIVENREATYLNNMNYAICMARAKDTCTVSYATQQQGGDQQDFQITNKDEAENDLVPDGQAGAGIFNCPDDYIAINQVRLCGERFNDGIESEDFTQHATVKDVAAGPIILPVRSDEEYVGRGFRLVYKQKLCV